MSEQGSFGFTAEAMGFAELSAYFSTATALTPPLPKARIEPV